MKLQSLSELEKLLPESDRNSKKFNETFNARPHNGKGKTVTVSLDTKGRKGKRVTIVSGLEHNPETIEGIARILKQYCGAGGTVKNATIEVQGDQRERVIEKLRALNYLVK